jgi:hypothetical protein
MNISVQPPSRKPMVAIGVSLTCVVYAASLPLQRVAPALHDTLAFTLGDGVKPTYYLRVCASVAVGVAVAVLVPRRPIPEQWLAWGTAVAVCVSVAVICAFP